MTTSTSTAGSPKTEPSDGTLPAPPPGAPSADLLEFLGEFSDDTGEWIDPLEIDDPEPGYEPEPGAGDD